MSDPPGNGNTLRYRVEQLEQRLTAHEEGIRYNAEGAIRRDDRIAELRKDMDEAKQDVKQIPVLRTEVSQLVDSWRAVRNAFLAAAGGMVLLAASIVWQATS